MSSYRVRDDEFSPSCEVISSEHAVDLVRGSWRIYEYHQSYSSTSGGFIVKGQAVRRYDSGAGILEGKFAAFPTKAEAISYWDRYIKPYEKLRA